MKKLLSLTLALLLALSLSACHGSQDRTAFTVPEASSGLTGEYEITFWAKNDTNMAQTNIYKQAIADFQSLYPNITVNLRLYTDYGDIYNDVITNIATETTPNVCISYPDHIATYLTGDNVVVPLDDLLTDPDYGPGGQYVLFGAPAKEEIVPQFLQECQIGGQTYALPYMRSTEACYINKDLVEALGYEVPDVLTWDFVWEVSDAAAATLDPDTGIYGVNGQEVLIPFIYKSTDNMMIQMTQQLGSGYSTAAGDIQLFNDTTSGLLLDIASHVAKGSFSTFKISSYPGNFLNAGQCIFAVDSTAGATWMGTDAPLMDIAAEEVVEFETVVRPVPQFDPDHPKMISQGPSVCVFNKEDPQEVLASWLFAQFLLTKEVQIPYSQTEGYVPVTTTAQEDPAYQDYLSRAGEDTDTHYQVKIDAAKLLLSNLENTFTTPVFNGSASLRDAAGQLIEEVTKSVRRDQPVNEDTIAQLYEDTQALYHLDSVSASGSGKRELGPLPGTSVALLSLLGAAWVCILLYLGLSALRRRRRSKKG